jgi:putative molybdopterin biosynthesis protein
VAALIASGVADAGMGARAAAERFGLALVPVGVEAYFLASRGSSSGTDMMNRVIAALHTSKKAESGYTFVNEAVGIPIAP